MKIANLALSGALTLVFMVGCKTTTPTQPDKAEDTTTSTVEVTSSETSDIPETQPEPKPELEPCDPEDEMCRIDRVGAYTIGWLSQGVPVATVLEKLGEPDKKEERFEEGASGDIYEIWIWEGAGVHADMLAADMTSPVTATRYFTVKAPFDGKTPKGIGIGSTEEEVLAAYAGTFDPHFTREGESLIAGSVYDGIFFGIKDGKVVSIFIGAGAE